MKTLFLCLSMLFITFAQTNFNNTCQNASLIPLLATGTINLNPLDTYNNGANKDYYQSLSLANFSAVDVLGYGFSLTGFQTGCSNNYYTLIIDTVEFQNQNTRMQVTVNFRNPGDGSITLWNLVSFSYIVVSRALNGAYSDIWATVAEVSNPHHQVLAAIDLVGAAYQTPTTGLCTIYQDPNYIFSPGCSYNTPSVGSGGGGQQIIHAYIMGFMWNPSKTTTQYLSAGVSANFPAVPFSDQIGMTVSVGVGGPYGPKVKFYNPNGAIQYIKVAFVISRLETAAINAGTYPAGSNLLYSSSYVYTPVTTFNTPVPIDQGSSGSPTSFNQFYYQLPDARYAIYGITWFILPKNTNTSCSTILINGTLNGGNTLTITTPNSNPTAFFVADIFTVNLGALCNSNPTTSSGEGQPQTTSSLSSQILTIGQLSFFTVPTQSLQQYIQEDSVAPISVPIFNVGSQNSFNFEYYGAMNGNTDRILFQVQIPFIGLTVGAPLKFQFGFFDSVLPLNGVNNASMISGSTYNIQLAVNGFILYQINYVAGVAKTNQNPTPILLGLNVNSTTANTVITVSYNRSKSSDQNLWTYLKLTQYTSAYDPTTGCCVNSCPPLTGLAVTNLTTPVCIYCNTQAGLVYNPTNGTCTCASGFYLDTTKTFQCYPCAALYCSICSSNNSMQCTTCLVGANLNNVTQTCICGNGFFVNKTTCQQCPYQCQNCSTPNAACITCVDPLHRDITQNCKCINGYYDSGAVNCSSCSATCYTCTNASACTSCDPTKFRNLTGTVCSCMNGYYELYNSNLTRSCALCNPECLTCVTSPAQCSSCDPKKNRVAGVGSNGVQTCLCNPGYYSTADGSCIQSNCNADPFCSQCAQGINICVQCLASLNRVLQQPASICVCANGYYANANNTCVACGKGCAICSSATNCTTCVTLATPSGSGSCACPNQTYFAVTSDGVRYCAACGPNCMNCVDANTCTTCLSSYTKTVDNKCICSASFYISSQGSCQPCANGCLNCTSSANNCNSCTNPLLLQGNTCQVSCNNGYIAIGSSCVGCPNGCLQCTQNLVCYYCADGYYQYNGGCYTVCPAGTVGDKTGGNWICDPCNSPCQTCINQPSYCTSCLNGMGYLQSSAVQQSCVLSCVDGTYIQNGVCQVCDFSCATCIGSATNCISCPANQVLYAGGCWAACPAISYAIDGLNATCSDSCPDGYYKVSNTKCAPCSPQCTTCSVGPSNCTSCLQGSVSINGTCSVTCGQNQFSFSGICIACSSSCYGCQYTPENCLKCASGYVQTGSICQKGCLAYQYYDNAQQKCIACGAGCATCSSVNFCTTCSNSAITPRGGVCSNCPYPCSTCDGTGACTACLSGFFYFQGACQTACPRGSSSVNGVCQCTSGIISLGQCVTSCGSGFTAVNSLCQPCNSNCAQCQGTVNTCTSCISGYQINAATSTCVSATQCPYGQVATNGVCAPICSIGYLFYETICIYGGCFSGYQDNGFGGCVRQTQAQAASGPNCNQNQYIFNGQCVGSCPSGYYPDSNSQQCLPCSANCVSCFNPSFCIVCGSGFQSSNGVCVAALNCNSTQYQYKGGCVNSCPLGTYANGQSCSRICGAGTYYSNQICFISCPSGLSTADACVTQCPSGTTNNNGICY